MGQVFTGCPRIGILANFHVISPLISIPDFLNFALSDNLFIVDITRLMENRIDIHIEKFYYPKIHILDWLSYKNRMYLVKIVKY